MSKSGIEPGAQAKFHSFKIIYINNQIRVRVSLGHFFTLLLLRLFYVSNSKIHEKKIIANELDSSLGLETFFALLIKRFVRNAKIYTIKKNQYSKDHCSNQTWTLFHSFGFMPYLQCRNSCNEKEKKWIC